MSTTTSPKRKPAARRPSPANAPRRISMGERISTWFAVNSEIWLIPLGLAIWVAWPFLIALIDPTAGRYDSAIFQKLIFAVVGLLVMTGFIFGIKMALNKTMHRFFNFEYNQKWNDLTSSQQHYLGLAWVALYSLAFCLLAMSA